MKKNVVRSIVMSLLVAFVATVGMTLIPRLTSPEEFVNAPSSPVHLLICFAAVFAVCVPISIVFYWLRDTLRR